MITLQDAISNHGLGVQEVILDGEIHRFSPDGKKSLSGWYVGHDNGDFQSGAYGDFKSGIKETFTGIEIEKFTSWQIQDYKKQRARQKAEIKHEKLKRNRIAKKKVAHEWSNAKTVGLSSHPYLIRKKIDALNVRIDNKENLLIPMYDKRDDLWNLQRINKDGSKFFTKGGVVNKCYHPIGFEGRHPGVIILAEGFSTAMSIYQAIKVPTVACFNAGNLMPATMSIRCKYPKSNLIIAGDDDRFNNINIGRIKAEITANHACAKAIFPVFQNLSTKPTDFNDLHCLESLEAVKCQIQEVL